jgi:hypothetical protein
MSRNRPLRRPVIASWVCFRNCFRSLGLKRLNSPVTIQRCLERCRFIVRVSLGQAKSGTVHRREVRKFLSLALSLAVISTTLLAADSVGTEMKNVVQGFHEALGRTMLPRLAALSRLTWWCSRTAAATMGGQIFATII